MQKSFAHILSTNGQLEWMKGDIIKDFKIIDPCAMVRKSAQHPEGYEICRAILIGIQNPNGGWENEHLTPRYKPGDQHWDDEFKNQGYHNEFTYLSEKEANKLINNPNRIEDIVGINYKNQRFTIGMEEKKQDDFQSKWVDPDFLFA